MGEHPSPNAYLGLALILVGIFTLIALNYHDWQGLLTLWATCGFAYAYVRHHQGHFELPKFTLWRPKPKLRALPDLPALLQRHLDALAAGAPLALRGMKQALNEFVRGAEVLYWDDVEVGSALPGTVRGPINQLDMTTYYCGAVGTSGYKSTKLRWKYKHWANTSPDKLPNNYDKSYYGAKVLPSIGHQDAKVATVDLGMPGPYDNGPQRCGMLGTVATNWMGDNGFVAWDGTGTLTGFGSSQIVIGGNDVIDLGNGAGMDRLRDQMPEARLGPGGTTRKLRNPDIGDQRGDGFGEVVIGHQSDGIALVGRKDRLILGIEHEGVPKPIVLKKKFGNIGLRPGEVKTVVKIDHGIVPHALSIDDLSSFLDPPQKAVLHNGLFPLGRRQIELPHQTEHGP